MSVEVAFVGVVRTDAVGGVKVVGLLAVGDDVDGAAEGVAAEPGGHHAFVDFNVVDEIDGKVGERHARTFGVEGDAVEKVADGIAGHAVDAQVEVGTYAAFLPDFHTGSTIYQTVERTDGAGHRPDVHGIDGKGSFAQLLGLRLAENGHVLKHHRIFHLAFSPLCVLCAGRGQHQQTKRQP